MKKIIAVLLAVLVVVSVFTGCGCEHQFEEKITEAATCKEEGEKTKTCTLCGDVETEAIPKLTTHKYVEKTTKAATCVTTGEKTKTCSLCGDKKTEAIPKSTFHKYTERVTKIATCGTVGEMTKTCSVCGSVKKETILKTNNHNYIESVAKKATCISSGTIRHTCSVCGDSRTETVYASGHNWKNATCTSPKTCSDCKETSGVALGHSYDSNGKCKNCGQTVSAKINLPSTPQTFSFIYKYSSRDEKQSSCTVTGITASLDYVGSDGIDYKITVSGTCTYNINGANNSTSMRIGYKLYDSDDIVVKSGTIYTESIAVGEKFKETISLYNLTPGETYRLEMLDVVS